MIMRPQFMQINGQEIAWYESRNDGLPIVFVHGNSLSSNTFIKQFEDSSLTNNFRLIAFDLPGHGDSSCAEEPERTYSFSGFISVLLEFVEKLNLQDAVFVGHSLGGHLVLDASENLPKAKAFVVSGTPPINFPPNMADYFLPNPIFPLAYKPDLTDEEVTGLASAFVNCNSEVLAIVKNDIERTHQDMRGYLGASLVPENLTNEVEIIKNLKIPIAIFHGKEDQLVNGKYLTELNIPTLWDNEIKMIHNSGHCPQLENPEMFNNILLNFLNEL